MGFPGCTHQLRQPFRPAPEKVRLHEIDLTFERLDPVNVRDVVQCDPHSATSQASAFGHYLRRRRHGLQDFDDERFVGEEQRPVAAQEECLGEVDERHAIADDFARAMEQQLLGHDPSGGAAPIKLRCLWIFAPEQELIAVQLAPPVDHRLPRDQHRKPVFALHERSLRFPLFPPWSDETPRPPAAFLT